MGDSNPMPPDLIYDELNHRTTDGVLRECLKERNKKERKKKNRKKEKSYKKLG